jgi:hypothetical protein
MPVILSNQQARSNFERDNFDLTPAHLNFSPADVNKFVAASGTFSADDILLLSGAPCGATVHIREVKKWSSTGDDRPLPGLYFFTAHSSFIKGENAIGLCYTPGFGYSIYIKDVFFTSTAPAGLAAAAFARIVRLCLAKGIAKITLFAAGGRLWPSTVDENGKSVRWGGYYFWARCGFNMQLEPEDVVLKQYFKHPGYLSACNDVRGVIRDKTGIEWWKVCGNGNFMNFDCSSGSTASVLALEQYLHEKRI